MSVSKQITISTLLCHSELNRQIIIRLTDVGYIFHSYSSMTTPHTNTSITILLFSIILKSAAKEESINIHSPFPFLPSISIYLS